MLVLKSLISIIGSTKNRSWTNPFKKFSRLRVKFQQHSQRRKGILPISDICLFLENSKNKIAFEKNAMPPH
jgi:hypothetical protein